MLTNIIYLMLGLQIVILLYMIAISQQIRSIRDTSGATLALARIRRVQADQRTDQAKEKED